MKIAFDYMSAADAMVEKGDLISALHYYFLQRNYNYDSYVDVAIGDVYMEMGLINEAAKYYMYAYAEDDQNKDALEGLVCAFKELDEEIAIYYLHCIAMLDDDDFELNLDDFELLENDPKKPSFSVHKKGDKSDIMDEAIEKLQSSDIEGGKELLNQIQKGDMQYCNAKFALASIALDESQPDKAIQFAEDIFEVDEKYLGGRMVMAMAYDQKGDREKVEEWAQKIDELNLTSEEDVTKIALCLINLDVDLAEKYVKLKYEFTPYEKITLMCLAAAYSKTDRSKAIKLINNACTIYPEDVELKEAASRIYGGSFIMPRDLIVMRKEWHAQIKEIFLNKDEDVCTPENIRRIKWLLQGENDLYLQAAVCTYVTGMPEFDGIINDLLCDPFANDLVKRHILLRKFCDERQKRVKFVTNNIFKNLKIKHPKVPENLKSAYYIVLSAIVTEEYNRESLLDRALKKLRPIYDACEERERLNMNALAVLLRNMAMGGDVETYLKIYDIDIEEYDKLLEKLGLKGE